MLPNLEFEVFFPPSSKTLSCKISILGPLPDTQGNGKKVFFLKKNKKFPRTGSQYVWTLDQRLPLEAAA